jgi:hypothetical protein
MLVVWRSFNFLYKLVLRTSETDTEDCKATSELSLQADVNKRAKYATFFPLRQEDTSTLYDFAFLSCDAGEETGYEVQLHFSGKKRRPEYMETNCNSTTSNGFCV